jgi:hypothetical protein
MQKLGKRGYKTGKDRQNWLKMGKNEAKWGENGDNTGENRQNRQKLGKKLGKIV